MYIKTKYTDIKDPNIKKSDKVNPIINNCPYVFYDKTNTLGKYDDVIKFGYNYDTPTTHSSDGKQQVIIKLPGMAK